MDIRLYLRLLFVLALVVFHVAGQDQSSPEATEHPPQAEDLHPHPQIQELTTDTFDDFVELEDNALLLEFYKEGESLPEGRLQHIQERAKAVLNITLVAARINSAETALLKRFRMDLSPVYPQILIRSSKDKKHLGKWNPFFGSGDAVPLLRFLVDANRPHSPEKLRTLEDVEQFIEEEHVLTELDAPAAEKPVVIGFFPRKRTVEWNRFRALVEELKDTGDSATREVIKVVGVHYVGHKHKTTPTEIQVRNVTISVPSIVIFKRDGRIEQYNPVKPNATDTPATEATPASEEEHVVADEEHHHDEDHHHHDEVLDSEEDHHHHDEEADHHHHDEEADHHHHDEETEEESHGKEHKVKKPKIKPPKRHKLTKEEKKLQELEDWKVQQRASAWRVTDMAAWLQRTAEPFVQEVGHWNFNSLLTRAKPAYLAFVNLSHNTPEEAVGTVYWHHTVDALGKATKDYGDRFTIGYVGLDRYPGIAKIFGMKEGLRGFVIVDPEENKFLPEEDKTAEGEDAHILAHIEAYLAGRLTPYRRSEPAPPASENEDNSDVPVKTVVFENFNKIVLDETKDVLLEYYIPGCHHCQALVPTFTALGEALSGEKDIVIAKMNMDVNDLPQDSKVTVKGYPTIYLYTARNKATPISYEGQRTVEAFLSFLKEHQTVAASIPSSGRDEL